LSVRTGILVALCAAGLGAAGVAARGSGSPPPRPFQGPDSRTQPVLDGCARDRGAILTHGAPNWVYVYGNAGQAQVQKATGIADSQYEPDLAAHPTGIDDPFTHTAYDFVFNLKLDAEYASLLGTGNFEGQGQETGRLHTERESASFPMFAWPDRGDRISVAGSWVWDCDHTGPSGEHTEIHPWRVLWVERNPGGPSPKSPAGDREADLFSTNAATPADTQAICAHETKADRTAFKECVRTPARPLEPEAFDFVLRAGPRPSRSARLIYRVIDRGSEGSRSLRVTRVPGGVRVREDAFVSGQPLVFAKQVFVGWRPVKPASRPVHLRLRLRELLVRRAMDPGCQPYEPECPAKDESTRLGQVTKSPGEWNVYVNAGGIWAPWRPLLIHPRDGQKIRTKQAIDFYVPRGKPWRLFVQTRECDFGSLGNAYSPQGTVSPCPRAEEVGHTVGDDVPGILVEHFRSPAAGLGTHRTNSQLAGSTCPASNRQGCFRLTYTVTRVGR
jgi:hypothetical protein